MTINEAINKFLKARPTAQLSQDMMIEALSRLDRLVKQNIIDTHEGGKLVFYEDYNQNTDVDTVLLIPAPYDDIYIDWLDIKNELLVKDYKRYNNACEVYDRKFTEFSAFYNRTHMPLETKRRLL